MKPELEVKGVVSSMGAIPATERSVSIKGMDGTVQFQMDCVKAPASWSNNAVKIVASKYFRNEDSVFQMVGRVAEAIREKGLEYEYLTKEASLVFRDELEAILLRQMAFFNSPVWFNVGYEEKPNISACYINSVDDTMESIMELAVTESVLFRGGSGSGTNLSGLRASCEPLSISKHSRASGPVSFMEGYDSWAGVIKSGGRTRRAACMRILNVDHPDIEKFINCKVHEESKARALVDAGFDGSFGGDVYSTIKFQNANNSVRVTDAFMRAVEEDADWELTARQTGETVKTVKARELFHQLAAAAHACGDPGIQYHDTINQGNMLAGLGKEINSSNPCSEFMSIDNTSCNLASLNLLTFLDDRGEFDIDLFKHVVRVILIAQDILCEMGHYPNEKITDNTKAYRPLGLGYANLGGLLMTLGIAYDSDKGRELAAAVTALMTSEAWKVSGEIAKVKGPFKDYERCQADVLGILNQHERSLNQYIGVRGKSVDLLNAARRGFEEALDYAANEGVRNSQVTLLAPCGTIGFAMDVATTGIEPAMALVQYKQMSDGGFLTITLPCVAAALKALRYTETLTKEILESIKKNGHIEDSPLLDEDRNVFACALKKKDLVLSPEAHIKMMAAVQPFLSSAISKTVNMPSNASVEDVESVYLEGWKMGLKSLAIYRDGSKGQQPIKLEKKVKEEERPKEKESYVAKRKKLPDERMSITKKVNISGFEGYITAGMYDNGQLGEVFFNISKEGSVVSGLMDCFATVLSIALQYGIPLEVFIDKFKGTRFEPSGFTTDPRIPMAKSIPDFLMRWLEHRFLGPETNEVEVLPEPAKVEGEQEKKELVQDASAPACYNCGNLTQKSGTCYYCPNCGSSTGCS